MPAEPLEAREPGPESVVSHHARPDSLSFTGCEETRQRELDGLTTAERSRKGTAPTRDDLSV